MIEILKPNEKLCLSFKEAADYCNVGENRIRKLADANPNAEWILHIDSRRKIKRPLFERFLDTLNAV